MSQSNYYRSDGDDIVVLVDNVRDDNFKDRNNSKGFSYIAGFFFSGLNGFFNRNIMTIDAFDWLHRTGANPPNEPVPGENCASAPPDPRPSGCDIGRILRVPAQSVNVRFLCLQPCVSCTRQGCSRTPRRSLVASHAGRLSNDPPRQMALFEGSPARYLRPVARCGDHLRRPAVIAGRDRIMRRDGREPRPFTGAFDDTVDHHRLIRSILDLKGRSIRIPLHESDRDDKTDKQQTSQDHKDRHDPDNAGGGRALRTSRPPHASLGAKSLVRGHFQPTSPKYSPPCWSVDVPCLRFGSLRAAMSEKVLAAVSKNGARW